MKRQLLQITIILSMLFSLSGLIYPVQAASTYPSLDFDQDGISNTMETTGWYNLAGGPYSTNPKKADTDQDGLTDAEEKLFNTNPNDHTSPGIAVKYDNAFKTFEYFKDNDPAYLDMVQGGNQYLLTEALVIRRGTTFKIAAKNTGGASLTISGSGLTALNAVRDPARGGWNVTVPAGGTVGTYTATITDGGWSKNLPIHVIFELPATTSYLTQAMINTFLYDDNPANKRDEVAVWFRVWYFPYNSPADPANCNSDTPGVCSDWQYHLNFGYAQAFWTEQYTKKVLVDYAMPAIQGQTTQHSAAQELSYKADDSVRVNYSTQLNSFSSATSYYFDNDDGKYHATGGACETNTGVFTSMLRSAGILARPFNLDYNKTAGHGENGNFDTYEYDHAVMMWASNSGPSGYRWFADRTSIQAEDEAQDTPIWHGGTTGNRPLDQVGLYNPADPNAGFGRFRDLFADLVQTVNAGWDYQNGSLGGGMVNTLWPIPDAEFDNPANPADRFLNRDYKWDSIDPLDMMYQSPYIDILSCQLWRNDTWAPSEWQEPPVSNPPDRDERKTYYLPAGVPDPADPLENWPYNPKPNACSPSSTDDAACTDAFRNQTVCPLLPGQAPLNLMQVPEFQPAMPEKPALNSTIQLMGIVSDAGLDQDGDGRFDKLVVDVEINSSVEGEYQLGGWLKAGGETVRADTSQVSLTNGLQTVQVAFDGQVIGDNQVDGPYQVLAIWAAPADEAISDLALPEEMTAYQTYEYATQSYAANEFIVKAAFIGENFTYTTIDENANGSIDWITISVPLNIAIPGTFTVEGDLYDGQGEFVGHVEWTGSDATAQLTYEVKQTAPPYSLEHVNLTDSNGKLLDARFAPVYKIEDLGDSVDQGNIFPGDGSSFSPLAITPTNVFSVTPVDSNNNGRYEQLVINTQVNVTGSDGTYRIEGLLVDDRGIPAAWSVSNPQTLTVGSNRTLQMTFNARMLFDQLPMTGSQKFNLIAVKIFSGNPGSDVLEAQVPVTNFSTSSYSRTQFEPSASNTIFFDDMESGMTKWSRSPSGDWNIVDTSWRSWSHAWMVNEAGNWNGTLTSASSLNLSNVEHPLLRFYPAYRLTGNATVMLEASDDGTTWDTLITYTGATGYWSSEIVDLSDYGKKSNVRLRFRGQSSGGGSSLLFYVDDVFLVAGNTSLYLPMVAKD